MEFYELAMALSVVLIVAVMDLLDASTEPHCKPGVPALPCGPVGAVGFPHPGPDARSSAGDIGVAPSPRPTPGQRMTCSPRPAARGAEADPWAARTRRTTSIRDRCRTTSNRTDRSVPHGAPDRLAMETKTWKG